MSAIPAAATVMKPFLNFRAFLRELDALSSVSCQPSVILDLSSVPLRSAGEISTLLKCIEAVAAKDGQLRILAPLPQTRVVLELTQIDRVVDVCSSLPNVSESEFTPVSRTADGAVGNVAA